MTHRDPQHASRALLALVIAIGVMAVTAPRAFAGSDSQLVWHARGAIDSTGLAGLSCPSAALCVGVDAGGNVVSTGRPSAGARAWKRVLVDTSVGDRGPNAVTGVTCPSASLCVAVDSGGNVLTSRNPRGDAAAWALTPVDTAVDMCTVPGGYQPCHAGFTAIACPSRTLCVAADSNGRIFATTDPRDGSRWAGFRPTRPARSTAAFTNFRRRR